MKSLLELIKALYGSKAIASTIGTKTNVIRLPSGKLQKYISKDLNIEAASDAAAHAGAAGPARSGPRVRPSGPVPAPWRAAP